ncbi:MAG: PAS domain S-box protein [Pirellulaceae bacterium]|nr:PAS domain S-box protein [Pirellulaceae bacterium]
MQSQQSQDNSQPQQPPPHLLDYLDGVYWEADPVTLKFSFLSGREDKLLGYPREKWYEEGFWVSHLHPEDLEWAPMFCRRATESLQSHRFDYRMLAADGRVVWIHDRVTVVSDDGKIQKVCGLLIDVTEKKETEIALQETRMKLSEAQRLTGLGYWDFDYTRERCTVSEETLRILGGPTNPAIHDISACRRALFERIHPDDKQRVAVAANEAHAGTKQYDIEYRLIVDGGEVRYVHSRGEIVRDASGKPTRWFGTLQETSQLRRMERELYESEIRFRTCLDHASDMLMILDENCCIIDVNQTACASLGYTREELVGQSSAFFDIDLSAEKRATIHEALDRGEAFGFETQHRRKDGSQFPVDVRIAPVRDCGNVRFVSLANNITERLNSQRALTENHKLMRAVINGTSDVIYVKDLDGHYLMINSAGADLFGLRVEDVLCRLDSQLPQTEAARTLLQTGDSDTVSNRAQQIEQEVVVDGKTCTFLSTRFTYYDAAGKAIGTIGISRDVTELKQLGNALRHAQKLEAVGRLAGGIAHDFNNLLTVIISYSELLLMSLPEGDPQRHQVNEIFKCGERAAGLTRQLLAFSRKQELQPKIVNLRQSLADLADLLQPIVGEDFELSIAVDENVEDVKMDLDQFRQAIVNLAVNACDAMPHGGKISIVVDDFVVPRTDQRSLTPHLKPGRYARISFSDTGIGMPEDVQARIFEPFYTTKAIGKGSGLGLSMIYGFVTQSGGHIEVSSTSGHGSTFRLYLPCAAFELLDLETLSDVKELQASSIATPKGKETILLVEDEETVRVLCCRILEACGYSVIQAKDGVEALEHLERKSPKIDLLLSDVVMPRMNGPKLLESIQQKWPQLPVIFISGYADEVVLYDIPTEKRNLLRKPFNPKQLAERVRATLEAVGK